MELIVAVGVGAAAIAGTLSIAHLQDDREGIDALALALLAVGPAALYVKRRLPVAVLCTHAFPFEEAAEAYAHADRRENGLIHAALRYR